MEKPWSRQFLYNLATQHRLTAKQKAVFILRYKDGGLTYDAIEREHKIKKANAQKHMTGVYEKFKIEGNNRGKDVELEQKLYELYQKQSVRNQDERSASGALFGTNDSQDISTLLRLVTPSQENSDESELEKMWNPALSISKNIKIVTFAIKEAEIPVEEVLDHFDIVLRRVVLKRHFTAEELLLFLLDRVSEYTEETDRSHNDVCNPID